MGGKCIQQTLAMEDFMTDQAKRRLINLYSLLRVILLYLRWEYEHFPASTSCKACLASDIFSWLRVLGLSPHGGRNEQRKLTTDTPPAHARNVEGCSRGGCVVKNAPYLFTANLRSLLPRSAFPCSTRPVLCCAYVGRASG